ncbi:MAG TPA: hypothetical protein VMR19_03500 [Candidatus Saccharimonadales bacterium]|jgi:hypothetical protein|nr:hypothetical protein [Candidatus Saccharimonadales bacterium]
MNPDLAVLIVAAVFLAIFWKKAVLFFCAVYCVFSGIKAKLIFQKEKKDERTE